MPLRVHGIELVDHFFNRIELQELVNDYVARHPRIRAKYGLLVIRFVEYSYTDEGESVAGWRRHNVIETTVLDAYQQYLSYPTLLIILYHELAHLNERDSALKAAKTHRPLRFSLDEEKRRLRQNERRAVRDSIKEMCDWVDQQVAKEVEYELRALR